VTRIPALDIWRWTIAFICAGTASLAVFAACVGLARRKRGARTVSLPWSVTIGVCLTVVVIAAGAGIHLIFWAYHDVPFAWYRSPILFPVVLVVFATMCRLVMFIYRGK
jgi:hypothetical protein